MKIESDLTMLWEVLIGWRDFPENREQIKDLQVTTNKLNFLQMIPVGV